MDFGGLLVLGIVWLLFNLIGQGKGRTRPASRPVPQPRPSGAPDPTQQEGSRLERLLREAERNLEEVEDRRSLEEPERVVSLETEVSRKQRALYDHDTEAETIARRRTEAARARDRALGTPDHEAFDARIRQEAADHTAVRRYTRAQLRDAVVWREILGPPVSER